MNNNMNFFIKQHSTLPEVKFPLTQRIREKYDITDEMMESVAVTFSMRDVETGVHYIANSAGKLITVEDEYDSLDESKYTLAYRFKSNQTRKAGIYEGEFKLDFIGDYCGTITLPSEGGINISIEASSTKTTVVSTNVQSSVNNNGGSTTIISGDGTAILSNTSGSQLSSTPVAPETNVDIIAPDATAIIKDQDGNILATIQIPSGETEEIILNVNII